MGGLAALAAAGSLFLVAAASGDSPPAGTIETLAGGSIGDGGAATSAPLNQPNGVAVDAAGNVYVADTYHHRIRRVAADGTITTVAGTGVAGSTGDGGAATAARLNAPMGLAMDGSGNLYVADMNNSRVRRVGTDGTITTVAGNGIYGFSGDGGAATSASLRRPWAVAVDGSGTLYVADTDNQRVRRVAGGTITTIAGTGAAGFSGDGGAATGAQLYGPSGIAVDASGNVFVTDTANQRVRRIATDGTITTVAGTGSAGYSGDGGAATSAALNYPVGLATDGSGGVLIADSSNQRIRRLRSDGTLVTVAGSGLGGFAGDGGPATSARLASPYGVAVDASGNVYVGDTANQRVRKIVASGTISTIAGNGTISLSGDGGPATGATLSVPWGVAADASGNVVIADDGNFRLRKVSPTGTITTLAPIRSHGLTVDASGNVYATEPYAHRVRKVATDGTVTTIAGSGTSGFSGDGGAATAAKLNFPMGVAVDASGNVYIADTYNNRVRKVATDGTITTIAGTGTAAYSGDGGAATSAALSQPFDVACTPSGGLLVVDYLNQRIRRIATDGTISTVAGNGSASFSGDGGPATSAAVFYPASVAVDPAGNFYFADGSSRVRMVTTAGIISTVAGNGIAAYSGDGGPATGAALYYPRGVAVTPAGDLLVADTQNDRVRRVVGVAAPAGVSLDGPDAVEHECDGPSGTSVPVLLTVGGTVPSGADLVVRDVTAGEPGTEIHRTGAVAGIMGFSASCPMGLTRLVAEVVSSGGSVLASHRLTIQVEDTVAPAISGVGAKTVELTGILTPIHPTLLGLSASDACDPDPTLTVAPSALPRGTTRVTATTTDASGNTASQTFDVTVADTTLPAFVVVPEDISADCTDGGGGATVVFDVLAEDLSGAVTIACVDENGRSVSGAGAWFAVGDHVVTCTATDASGNAALAWFRVRVLDVTDPVLIVPDDIRVGTDTGACTAAVSFTVTASDDCSPDVTVSCTADGVPVSSGDAFPCGTTVVTCVAVDGSGNTATAAFRIVVVDDEAPRITAPAAVTLVTDCAGRAIAVSPALLGVTCTDNCDVAPVLTTSPSTLAPGTTSVVVTARDDDGNASTATVSVTVLQGAFEVDFLRPLEAGIDNAIQVGRVVPVQVKVSCDGVARTDVTATIDAVVRIDGAGTPIAQSIDDAGLSGDEGSAMRLADGAYKYNLSTAGWADVSGARFRVTVRIARTGHVDTLASVVLRAK